MIIRPVEEKDHDAVWEIFREVIKTGDTYVFEPDTPRSDLEKHWFAPYMQTYVAEVEGRILGTYILKSNQIGLGNHIANASYMVHPSVQGEGIGRKLCEHSLEIARRSGFKGIQFNIVVSTNQVAVQLWKNLGFRIIGTTPKAFNHQQLGYVDSYIMYREL